MYVENVKSINDFVGCRHGCVYCVKSFQRQMKRQKCVLCKRFEPHLHADRLGKNPPRTKEGEFIFFPSAGDPCFMKPEQFQAHIDYAKKWKDMTFLIQSKNPEFFLDYEFPDNVILGTTIETNCTSFSGPSEYQYYAWISCAPSLQRRFDAMLQLEHKRKAVTVEPILEMDIYELSSWIHQINPELVWVGYDNHGCKLPEPTMTRTLRLIEELKDLNVKKKTIRKAWFEK